MSRFHSSFDTFGRMGGSLPTPGAGASSGDDMAAITKTITLAEINALGAVTAGEIAFGSALPAGSVPVAIVARRLQASAITSSGGTPTTFSYMLVTSGQTSGLTFSRNLGVDADDARYPLYLKDAKHANALYPYESETTYGIYLTVAGSGVTLGNLDGPTGNVLEVTLVYYDASA